MQELEICQVISYYSSVPMLYVNIVTEEVTITIRYVIGIGYTLASEYGIIEADSYNKLIHMFKLLFCPSAIITDFK